MAGKTGGDRSHSDQVAVVVEKLTGPQLSRIGRSSSEWEGREIGFDPSAPRLNREQMATAVVREQPVGATKGRSKEFAQDLGSARMRPVVQIGTCDAD
jgi:hypothetical protein